MFRIASIRRFSLVWSGIFCLTGVGCMPFLGMTTGEKSPLRPFQQTNNQAVIEITTLRLSPQLTVAQHEALWQTVDEQSIPLEVRRRLAANGFRAGVINGEYPDELRNLLETAKQPGMEPVAVESPPATAESRDPAALREETPTANLNGNTLPEEIDLDGVTSKIIADDKPAKPRMLQPREPGLRTHTLYLQTGQTAELQPGGVHGHWPLLKAESGSVHGRSLSQAQGVWQLSARTGAGGGRVLRMAPEIQFGEAKPHWVGDDGMIRQEFRKPRELLSNLEFELPLSNGQSLLIAPLPDRPGSIGHYFMSQAEQPDAVPRLLLLRVAADPLDELWR